MPRKKVTYDVVREIALGLPEVEEGTKYGSPAFMVRGELLAGIPANKSVEPGSLGVRIDFEQRAALLAEAPDTYYITDHYAKYPAVIVRMSQIQVDQMRDLLNASWKFTMGQKKKTHLKER